MQDFYSAKRPRLRPSPINEITQGTIISCAKVNRYEGCHVFFVIITARCDIAQEKFPILNCLPVVPLNYWMRADGLDILLAAVRKKIQSELKSALSEAGHSVDVLRLSNLRLVCETLFGEKSQRKRQEKFLKSIEKNEAFEKVSTEGGVDDTLSWINDNYPKEIPALIDRLSKHDIAGSYMFDVLIEENPKMPYVALLRNIFSISRELAHSLRGGVSKHLYQQKFQKTDPGVLEIGLEDLAAPVCCVDSPTIEHLLQSFTSLFSRIGLDDPNQDYLADIKSKDVWGVK